MNEQRERLEAIEQSFLAIAARELTMEILRGPRSPRGGGKGVNRDLSKCGRVSDLRSR